MIGRQEQLENILAATDAVATGSATHNVLFVTGEAGIGKTTLLHEAEHALAHAHAHRRILSRFATPDTTVPSPLVAFAQCSTPLAGRDIGEVESLQPWAEIMAQLLERSAKEVVEKKKTKFDFAKFFVDTAPAWVTMVPVLGPSVGAALEIVGATYDQYYFNRKLSNEQAAQNAANQQQVFQQYINFLAKASAQQPLVLIIDDFHWADTSSANLLFTAARELRGKPIVFLIAYRADDAMSSRGGEGHPLLHIRNELQRYDLIVDIDVPMLTGSDLDQLLHSLYPHYRNSAAFEQWLLRAGSGNALFITQFLTTLEEDGYIDAATGNIREGFELARVPASAQAVVQERIRRLNEDTRELLRYASVEGDTFTSTVLACITEVPQLRLLQKLRIAEETYRFIRSLGRQRLYAREMTAYKFTHVLMHKVLYDSLGEEERELLHEAVFAILKEEWESALQEQLNIEGVAARLAVHAEILGQYDFAIEVLLEGARSSWKEFAEEEALHQLRKAFALLQNITQNTETNTVHRKKLLGEAYILQAQIDTFHARHTEALRCTRQAKHNFEEIGNQRLFCSALATETEILRTTGNLDEAEECANKALRMSREAGLHEVESGVMSELGAIMYLRANNWKALEFLLQSLELLTATDYHALWRTLNNIGLAEVALGHYDSALEYFHRSLDALRFTKNRASEASYLNNISIVQYQSGNFGEAIENLRASMDIRRSLGDNTGVATSLHNIGLLHMMREELDEAFDCFTRSLELAHALDMLPLLARVQVNLGNAERKRNANDSALDYFWASLKTARSIDNRDGMAIALISLGSLLRVLERYGESKPLIEEALVISREIARRDYEGVALGELAMLRKDTTNNEPDRAGILREIAEELRHSVSLLEHLNQALSVEWKAALESTEQELRTAEAQQQ